MKFNKKMFLVTMLILLLEVIIALFVKDKIVRPYLGDILVVILIYTFIRSFDNRRIKALPIYILGFAVLIEISQLFELVKLLGLEDYRLAQIILGSTFDYKDIICYAVGAILLLIYEMSSVRRDAIERRKRQARRNRRRMTSEQRVALVWKVIKRLLAIMLIIGFIGGLTAYVLNLHVIRKYDQKILNPEAVLTESDVDCIMVLGAGVWSDDTPSPMLNDRLEQGIKLYEEDVSNRLLMSGDHGRVGYDEVNVMKQFAVDTGIDPEHVFMDHAGFSTYESMVRAKEIFGVEKMIIITQEYHLYRALYIANELGIDASGVHSDLRFYPGQGKRDTREVAARIKDYFYMIFRPDPTYLGAEIPISGSGSLTDDKDY